MIKPHRKLSWIIERKELSKAKRLKIISSGATRFERSENRVRVTSI